MFAASYLPSLLVPLTGLIFPAVAMALLFVYIEREEPTGLEKPAPYQNKSPN